jgi:ATP-binding cassette, subfamily B, multidrug efflux pump
MGIVLRYVKPYWKQALFAVFLMTVEVVCDLAQPTLMSNIIDGGVKGGRMGYIALIGAIMAGVTVVGMFGGIGCTVFASIAAMRTATDLRSDLFRKVQSFSFDGLDSFSTGSLVTRLTNDVVQVQNLILTMLRIMVRAPLLCIGGIVMAFAINAKLAVVLFVALPFLAAALTFVIAKGFPLFGKVQTSLDRVNAVMRENLAGVRLIKAFVRTDYEVKRFGDSNERLTEITVKASRVVGLVMPLMFLIMNLAVVAVVWLSGVQVNEGAMEVGKVMAFTTYISQIMFSLMMISFTLMSVSRATASARRIAEVMNHESERDVRSGVETGRVEAGQSGLEASDGSDRGSVKAASGGAIAVRGGAKVTFEDVSFRYPQAADEPVLRGISFTALPGETVGILGSTGSGKSTLVNLIPRFYEATGGRVLVDGTDVRDIPLDELRGMIGIVPQDSVLFSGTIADNIRWGKADASEDEIVAAAKAAQAHDFVMRMPKGYGAEIGQRGVGLSGGQKQRLCIARALVRRPAVLILDDSTSAVDMGTEARIQTELKAISGFTILVIAQRVSSVLDADRIIVLEDGRIVGSGTHEELVRTNPVYQDIYHSQVGEAAVNG